MNNDWSFKRIFNRVIEKPKIKFHNSLPPHLLRKEFQMKIDGILNFNHGGVQRIHHDVVRLSIPPTKRRISTNCA